MNVLYISLKKHVARCGDKIKKDISLSFKFAVNLICKELNNKRSFITVIFCSFLTSRFQDY